MKTTITLISVSALLALSSVSFAQGVQGAQAALQKSVSKTISFEVLSKDYVIDLRKYNSEKEISKVYQALQVKSNLKVVALKEEEMVVQINGKAFSFVKIAKPVEESNLSGNLLFLK